MRFFLLTSFCLLALLGCGGTESEQKVQSSETKPAASGQKVYTVLTYPQYAPYQYIDEKGHTIGFDIDMIQAIADSQNIKIKIQEAAWVGMLDELNKGNADLVISGISRQQAGGDEKYTLSNAYLHGKDAILTKDTVTNINTMNDMLSHTIGVQSNTIFADELTKRKGANSPSLKQTETSFMAFKELVNGNVEAVYAHENILRHYAQGWPEFKFKLSGTGDGFQLYDMVIVAKKGNNELIQTINAGIQQVHANGTYKNLHIKWFGVEPPQPQPQPQP